MKPEKDKHLHQAGVGCFITIAIFFVIFIIAVFHSDSSKEKIYTKEQKDSIRVFSQFNHWDGSHIKITEYLTKKLRDPDSYKHVKTVYWITGNNLIVKTEFRARNGFGGMMIGIIEAEVDSTGEILQVLNFKTQ